MGKYGNITYFIDLYFYKNIFNSTSMGILYENYKILIYSTTSRTKG